MVSRRKVAQTLKHVLVSVKVEMDVDLCDLVSKVQLATRPLSSKYKS